jgi:radical SAM superfamily enzyme YgiQ (UPF0313 family)
MRVLLLHTPMTYEMADEYLSDSPGLGYIAALLRRDGHEVEILDALLRDLRPRDLVPEILAREYDCLGITANHDHTDVLIPLVRELRKRRNDALIIVGGYLPTLSTEDLLRACPEIDIAVRGEAEISVPDLFGRIDSSEEWRTTPGIAYLQDGSPVITRGLHSVSDLDSLPFPARDGLLQRTKDNPVRLVRIVGSRGCYGRCSFCSIRAFHAISGHSVPRVRSPKNIVDEIECTVALTGLTAFKFTDDDFIGPNDKTRRHAMEVAEELKSRRLPITFEIECRADVVNEDILTQLKEVGLTRVFVGIESGVQAQLDRFNKHLTVEDNRRAIETIRGLGLQLSSGFITFDPYVTVGEVAQNLQFLSETGISSELAKSTSSQVMHKALARLAVFPGAPLARQLKADGLLVGSSMTPEFVFKDRWVRLLDRALRVFEFIARFIGRFRRAPSTAHR